MDVLPEQSEDRVCLTNSTHHPDTIFERYIPDFQRLEQLGEFLVLWPSLFLENTYGVKPLRIRDLV